MMTPQYFEYENGLYVADQEDPSIYDEEEEESHSIYHLFENEFESYMDSELIKTTAENMAHIASIRTEEQREIEAEADRWIDVAEGLGGVKKMSEYKKLMLRLVDNQLVIGMDNHEVMKFKAVGYTGLPQNSI